MVVKIMAIFHKYPSFVVTVKVLPIPSLRRKLSGFITTVNTIHPFQQDTIIDIMRDGTHPNRKELILSLCWIVGEYASVSISPLCTPRAIVGNIAKQINCSHLIASIMILAEYHEVLETLAFERISLAKMELVDPNTALLMASASTKETIPSLAASEPLPSEQALEQKAGKQADEKAYSSRLMIVIISG